MEMTVQAVRSMIQRSRRSLPNTSTAPLQPSPTFAFDNFTVGAIRRKIYDKFQAKEVFTITTLTKEMRMTNIIPESTSETSVWRLIHNMGFRYKTSQRKMYVRKESLDMYVAGLALFGPSNDIGKRVGK